MRPVYMTASRMGRLPAVSVIRAVTSTAISSATTASTAKTTASQITAGVTGVGPGYNSEYARAPTAHAAKHKERTLKLRSEVDKAPRHCPQCHVYRQDSARA